MKGCLLAFLLVTAGVLLINLALWLLQLLDAYLGLILFAGIITGTVMVFRKLLKGNKN